ncbi:Ras family protein [Tritrichomonas foetus]|uniref:Ras family protein n=1 Tax=Tritrichomonas foetus TaxID=1144522 RepID=A0A1J4JEI0_9EUKA|nr:Ras family protein [Tritrichomonas foetus]|eukprot:OHS95668.1 Ras family protein [Tritrichomonas foetus]
MMSPNKKNADVKAVVLGESRVGKTALATRYTTTVFNENTAATINAACFNKEVSINNTPVKYYIWDTAGQEQFRSLSPIYYRSCNVAIIVYDITNISSIEVTNFWVTELRDNGPQGVPIVVLGNKSDLSDLRQISEEDGRSFAESIGAAFYEVSALSGNNVETAFNKALDLGYEFARTAKSSTTAQSAFAEVNNGSPPAHANACC